MSDLGLMLTWSAVQVSLVLAAAAALHALARRRSPASGAWVASLGLGLTVVVGLVSVALQAWAPALGMAEARALGRTTITPAGRSAAVGGMAGPVGTVADDRPRLKPAQSRTT